MLKPEEPRFILYPKPRPKEADMKRLVILLLVLLPCLHAFTLDLGFAADVYLTMTTARQDASRASEYDLVLTPAMVLMMNPKLELRPFLVLEIQKASNPDDIPGPPTILKDWGQFSLGLGSGLYYHFIQREIIELSVGPKATMRFYFKPTGTSALAYSSYFGITLDIALPVNLDFKLTKKLTLRTGIEIPGLLYENTTSTTGGVTTGTGRFYFIDFQTGSTPYFGFFYML
jgi:hypothetical protein